jgi:hypothetical protein
VVTRLGGAHGLQPCGNFFLNMEAVWSGESFNHLADQNVPLSRCQNLSMHHIVSFVQHSIQYIIIIIINNNNYYYYYFVGLHFYGLSV